MGLPAFAEQEITGRETLEERLLESAQKGFGYSHHSFLVILGGFRRQNDKAFLDQEIFKAQPTHFTVADKATVLQEQGKDGAQLAPVVVIGGRAHLAFESSVVHVVGCNEGEKSAMEICCR